MPSSNDHDEKQRDAVDPLQMAVIGLIDDTNEEGEKEEEEKKTKEEAVVVAVADDNNETHKIATASRSKAAHQPGPDNNADNNKDATVSEQQHRQQQDNEKRAMDHHPQEATTVGILRQSTTGSADTKGSNPGTLGLQRADGSCLAAGAYAMAPRMNSNPVLPGDGVSGSNEAADDRSVHTCSSASSASSGDEEEAPLEATTLLEAVAVDDVGERAQIEEDVRAQIEEDVKAQIEMDVRQKVMNEAVQADVILDDKTEGKSVNKVFLGTLVLLVIVLALALGLGLGLSDGGSQAEGMFGGSEGAITSTMGDETPPPIAFDGRPTLDIVQERGYVNCGLFAPLNLNSETGELLDSFGTTYCKAMALATLGDPDKFESVWITATDRFLSLANGTIDIDIYGTTFTMARDIHEKESHTGFTFSTPYLYVGLAFAGDPFFVDCAEALDSFHDGCRDLKICVEVDTTHMEILSDILDGGAIVPSFENMQSIADNFASGRCNVVAAEAVTASLVSALYEGEWKMGTARFSKEPLSMVTREDDPEWSTLANMIVNTFFVAEAHNISKDNAHLMASLVESDDSGVASTALRGRQGINGKDLGLASLMVELVANFGNQGDFYDLTVGPMLSRTGLNLLYDKNQTSGLLYAIPFGTLDQSGPGPIPNGTLDTVQQRGYLTCGVRPSRGPAFAARNSSADDIEWSGFDVEFCRGLAASLFVGDTDKIVFVELPNQLWSYLAVQNGTVDVVAGARVSLQAEYKEPATGTGFAFSTPYYYDNESRDAFAFMTRKNDVQWSDLVNWVVMATIYAEEEGIVAETSIEMPISWCFGEYLKQMFRDTIAAVGSYAELYNNTIEQFIPRAGANRLNAGLSGPQIFPIPVV